MKVFITGGTTGIGLELSKLYLEEGWVVGVCGRDLSKYPADIKKQYPKLFLYQLDVTNREKVLETIGEFSSDSGLDLLIASAGRSVGKKTPLPNFEASIDVVNTNVLGLLYTIEAALKYMLPYKKGHLVAIASVAGMMGLPGASSYSASKAAVLKLCESYALDLESFGIKVTAIAPGFIDTPLTRQNDHSMPFLMSAELGAKKIKKAIVKEMPLYVFPLPMQVLVFILERLPRFLYRIIMKKMYFKTIKKDRDSIVKD